MKTFFFIPLFFIGCNASTSDRTQPPPVDITAIVSALIKDTVYKAKQIAALKKNDSIYNIKVNSEAAKLSAFLTRFIRDSVNRGKEMKAFIAKRRADSLKVALEINKLKGASPVTQIPIMQNDIKNIKSKNLSQDKILVSHTSSIQDINDTILVLKVDAGPDFNLNKTTGKFQISPAGMVRIKANMQQ